MKLVLSFYRKWGMLMRTERAAVFEIAFSSLSTLGVIERKNFKFIRSTSFCQLGFSSAVYAKDPTTF